MITTRIQIESYLAEYVRGKYYDETVGTVRFPSSSDIYAGRPILLAASPRNSSITFPYAVPPFLKSVCVP